jgi:prophage regulatory protein
MTVMTTSPRFLSVKNVADELAITETAVYTLLKTGEIPAIQVGPKRVWRIERAKLEEYIERQYAAARDAIARGQVEPDSQE